MKISVMWMWAWPLSAGAVDLAHQGRVLDGLGQGIDGQVDLTIALWGQEAGGDTTLWSDTVPDVNLSDGYYTVILEDVDPAKLLGDVWIGVTVGTGSEMAPRQRLTSAPRAAALDAGAVAEGELVLAAISGTSCTTTGAISYEPTSGAIRVCRAGIWRSVQSAAAGGSGSSSADPGVSCRTIKQLTGTVEDKLYWVDPNQSGDPIEVWCDMSTDGGGWTLVARASDTNGVGDYEFRLAVGDHSVLDLTFDYGSPSDAQYLLALQSVLEPGRDEIDIQYLCYDNTNRAATEYWAHATPIPVAALVAGLGAANPDMLFQNVSVANKDGNLSTTGNFALFKRYHQASGFLSCGNSYAGQSGIKFSCGESGQAPMSDPSVWMLTHYLPSNGAFTPVNSCGSVGANVMANYRGEVRIR